jgi:hypothetical protein
MAHYKHIDTPPRLLAVDLAAQSLPGTFEHEVQHLVTHELDLSGCNARFRHDATWAPAYQPGVLLAVVLFAYAQGNCRLHSSPDSVRTTCCSWRCAVVSARTSRRSRCLPARERGGGPSNRLPEESRRRAKRNESIESADHLHVALMRDERRPVILGDPQDIAVCAHGPRSHVPKLILNLYQSER